MIRVFDTQLTAADARVVQECVASGWVGPGRHVTEFERLLCEATGKKHAICCNSGTTALMLCLLELSYGTLITSVRVPAYGMHAAAEVAMLLKLKVELYDLGVDPALIPNDIRVGINQNGLPCGRCDIQDACQSLGIPGAFQKHLCTLSFSPQKLVTTGQGGAVLTDDDDAASTIRGLIDHGGNWRETGIHERIGGNWRMSDLNAALGVSQMRRLPELLEKRAAVHAHYHKRLDVECGWCVTIRSLKPKSFIEHLRERGIQALQPYQPLHRHPPFDTVESFPNAEREAREIVYLPSSPHLTTDEINAVCDAVQDFS